MNSDRPVFPATVSVVMIIATATLGWFAWSPRPIMPAADNRTSPISEQNIIARLWEDPFQAVQSELAKPPEKRSSPTTLERMKADAKARMNGKRLCLLVVPIPETPFPNDSETRLRTRYSVQMALSKEKYAPDDRDHLGYLKLPGFVSDTGNLKSALGTCSFDQERTPILPVTSDNGVHVPYEWFMPRDDAEKNKGPVLVLWLPERRLRSKPLNVLNDLGISLTPDGQDDQARIFVVGPRSSDTLIKMVPAEGDEGAKFPFLKEKLSIFSPQATTPDRLIGLEQIPEWAEARNALESKLRQRIDTGNGTEKVWRYFYNFIAPDDQLTDLLVNELAIRGVNLNKKTDKTAAHDRILILAEADTSYGQFLPIAFQASLQNYGEDPIDFKRQIARGVSNTHKYIKLDVGEAPGQQVLVYRYLKGLDQQKGQSGNEKTPTRSIGKSPEEALVEVLSRKAAMPLGESQLDYVDRLADDVQRSFAKKQVKPGKTSVDIDEIKAVGVLGGDIYDKLILLRSLRTRFPQAVFFTTDLDARMWHPDHLPFTRNLVVASAYGLEPDDDMENPNRISNKMPSFRDGYQVAVFEACRAALKKGAEREVAAGAKNVPAQPKIETNLRPTIFELGRNGPQRLNYIFEGLRENAAEQRAFTVPPGLGDAAPWREKFAFSASEIWEAWKTMDLPLPKVAGRQNGLWLILAGMLMALVLWAAGDWVRNKKREERVWLLKLVRPRNRLVTLSIMLSLLLLLLFYAITKSLAKRPDGEPWAWGQGISIWPTELVRLLIILTVVISLIWAWRHHVACRSELADEFFLRSGEHKARSRTIRDWISRLHSKPESCNEMRSHSNKKKTEKPISANEMFQCYISKSQFWRRAFRTTLATLAYMFMAFGMIFCVEGDMPENPHIRGDVARFLDRSMLLVSIICFLWLLFYVLDAVIITGELLSKISEENTTEWPVDLLNQEATKYGVDVRDLAGYLDVRFAAVKSKDTGTLIFFPFIIQFLFIASRNSYFDNWSWPPALFAIFVCNIALASIGWLMMRNIVRKIRRQSEDIIHSALSEIGPEPAGPTEKAPNPQGKQQKVPLKQQADPQNRQVDPQKRRVGLQKLLKEIKKERRGAYAHIIQDPAVIAMLLPTGAFGILLVLFRAFFGGM